MDSIDKLHRNIGIALGIIVILAVGGITFFEEAGPDISSTTPISVASTGTTSGTGAIQSAPIYKGPTAPTPASSKNATTAAVPPADTPKQTASVYTDGTYSATGSYMSPGGEDKISVTLTLANDIITSVSATSGAGDHTSQRYQNAFLSGYKQYVVGQNIASVNLTRVSGSSLTPIGFDAALAQIKSEAQV